jgi:hypothetical protein
MARESEKVQYTLDKINNETLKSGKGMRKVSADLFAALITIVELQQKQIDELWQQSKNK